MALKSFEAKIQHHQPRFEFQSCLLFKCSQVTLQVIVFYISSFQDRQYLQNIEMARLRTMEQQQDRRFHVFFAGRVGPPELVGGCKNIGM